MHKFFITLFLLLSLGFSSAGGTYEVSVLTCSPGRELYSIFGHTAIRIQNTETGSDAIYNFGMFNFNTPNFYPKFVRGDLDYFLAAEDLDSFLWQYTFENRSVVAQIISLPDEYISQIVENLENLSLPANRYYRYKFINANCTTAVRDLLVPFIEEENPFLAHYTDRSAREYLNGYLVGNPWIRLGINLIMGSKTDRNTTMLQSMFLPDLLFYGLSLASHGGAPLVKKTKPLNNVTPYDNEPSFFGKNAAFFIIALVCLAVILSGRRFVYSAFLLAVGLLGLIICFVTLYGQHIEFKANYNLLWCNPLLLLFPLGIYKRMGRIAKMILAALLAACYLGMFFVWAAGVQGFEASFLLVLLTSAVILARGYMSGLITGKKG